MYPYIIYITFTNPSAYFIVCIYMVRYESENVYISRSIFIKKKKCYRTTIIIVSAQDFPLQRIFLRGGGGVSLFLLIIVIWFDCRTPLIVLNLKKALCDVRWSPFSSTVFVILTVDCHLIFYDLDVSMKKPVCDQLIQPADEYRPTRMVFNKLVPIVLVGSSR